MTEKHHDSTRERKIPAPRGIFDCDDAYRTPVSEDYERLFTSGMVALDTNVLLNLYRSNERTRRDTFSVLERLRERLWIPHQVLSEFWRNRDLPSVRGHHRSKAKDACAALDKAHRSMSDALDRWLKDVHLSNDANAKEHLHRSKKSMESALSDLKSFIQAQAERDALKGAAGTQSDPVLAQLDEILRGRIGEPFPKPALLAAISEAEKRSEKRIPPGYEDFKDKPAEQAAGDYLIWAQLLDEAERRKSDVLLVTGDVKADWWVPGTSHTLARPRMELVVELRDRAAAQLYMVTPSQLLVRANEIFNLQVDKRSVSDLETAEQEQRNPWPYNQAVERMVRQQFPEAEVLTLDEQLGRGALTPIPDIWLKIGGVSIGIEVRNYVKVLEGEDLRHLENMIKTHNLQAVLIVSSSPLSRAAIEYLRDLASKSDARVAWAWINKVRVDELGSREALRASIESLIGPYVENAEK
ncbi:PIN-like domain-containing protein [Streptomyces griseorubiginosus]|uniref:PIN-like domain-containing protein n=1 Tax=Streptomyces griseorubiginosus TaxID=67304 RepID=UPI00331FE971